MSIPKGWTTSSTAADWTTTREAAALVKHLAANTSTRESLVAASEADPTISDAVRAAAIRQAGQFLFHWEPMLAGHRAAQRRDWAAAINAFDRVTTLAPDDVMHWHWLAMASLAADRHDTYQRACEELLRRYGANASSNDLFWTLVTWLVAPHDDKELALLKPLVDAHVRRFVDSRTYAWLYELRTGNTPREALDSAIPPATLGVNPGDRYVLAMVWLKLGDKAQAVSAYDAGARQARLGSLHWNWQADVYHDTIRRELEALLAAEPSPDVDHPPRATAAPASPSDAPPAGE